MSSVKHFIDEYTTVSIHENTVGQEVARIAQEVNKHHHTKTCRKHDTSCRFRYPRFPAPYTIIVRPVEGETQAIKDAKMAKHMNVLRKVKEVLEDEDQVKNIMKNYKKQEESKQDHKHKRSQRIKDLLAIAGVE